MLIWLATVVALGRAETVVCKVVRSLWLALSAKPLVSAAVVARGAIAAEMARVTLPSPSQAFGCVVRTDKSQYVPTKVSTHHVLGKAGCIYSKRQDAKTCI